MQNSLSLTGIDIYTIWRKQETNLLSIVRSLVSINVAYLHVKGSRKTTMFAAKAICGD